MNPGIDCIKAVEAIFHLDEHVINAPISLVAGAIFECNFKGSLSVLQIPLPGGATNLLC